MKKEAQFKRTHDQVEGVWFKYHVIKCSSCDKEGKLKDQSQSWMPTEFVSKKFHQQGWSDIGGGTGTCPECIAMKAEEDKAKRELTKAQKRAVWCKLNDVKRSEIAKPKDVPVITAVQPRQPTREERRKIIDALDETYIPERECYAKSWSDKSLSAKLDMPRAWIAEERDRAYGPDRNEAQQQGLAEIEGVLKTLRAKEDAALALAADFEKLRKEVEGVQRKLSAA